MNELIYKPETDSHSLTTVPKREMGRDKLRVWD